MKFSLIMATYGRDKEIENFLNSLKNQTYKNFELIVIDQNEDDKALKIIKNFENEIEIKYFRVNFRGLSKARNFGLNYATGDIIAFPDDDCEYPKNLLFEVKKFFEDGDFDILSVLVIDKLSKKESLNRWISKSSHINSLNILRAIISPGLFIKISNINIKDIYFDEKFGVGSIYPSAEETDLVFRLIKEDNAKGYFNRNLFVYHPIKEVNLNRFYPYGIGMGAFLRKHINKDFSLLFLVLENLVIRPIGGILLNILKLNKFGIKKNFYNFIGRWKGFLSYKP
ncbi:MAG: glycosyltransferase family 2 protein [candidate division WOR-3 bacterium]